VILFGGDGGESNSPSTRSLYQNIYRLIWSKISLLAPRSENRTNNYSISL